MPDQITRYLNRHITVRTDRQYLLVVGSPRSGTTLLASMIGCHPQVGILNEDVTGKWMNKILSKHVVANKLCIPNQLQMKRRSFSPRLFKKLGFVEEAPRSILSLEEYLDVPTLKVVAIIRDGNDVIASMIARGRSNFRIASHRWVKAIETIYELRALYPDRVRVVAFERLVLEAEVQLRDICNFVGLSFERAMLDGYHTSKYRETRLNEEKVHRHSKEKFSFQLEQRFPSTHSKYRQLLTDVSNQVREADLTK